MVSKSEVPKIQTPASVGYNGEKQEKIMTTTTSRPMPGRPENWKLTPAGVSRMAKEGRAPLAYALALQLKREREGAAPAPAPTGRSRVLEQRERMLKMAAGVH